MAVLILNKLTSTMERAMSKNTTLNARIRIVQKLWAAGLSAIGRYRFVEKKLTKHHLQVVFFLYFAENRLI